MIIEKAKLTEHSVGGVVCECDRGEQFLFFQFDPNGKKRDPILGRARLNS